MAFDVAVIGLGAMGACSLYELARRDLRTVGIERETPGHDGGSSHGETRMIRLGYFEHPSYMPLLHRTYEKWRALETVGRRKLITTTGIAEIGPPDSALVEGTLACSRIYDLRHEVFEADALMRRYPAFRVPKDFVGVVQPDAGVIEAAVGIDVCIALAAEGGADIRLRERVIAVEPFGSGVRVRTDRNTIEAGSVIVAAGPWVKSLLPCLAAPLWATRQVSGWFEPRDPAPFANGRFPAFLLESRHGIHYGFPPHAEPVLKLGKHHHADQKVEP